MNSILNKRIPTVLGLFLLAVAVLATSYLVNTGVIYFGGAAPSDNPQDVRITNVSDSSFTVTYKTSASVLGTIAVSSSGQPPQTILDDRDEQSGIPKSYQLHSITVKKLKPATAYTFSITSGTTVYQNNGAPFSATTAPMLSTSPSATTPVTGKILDSSGNIPQEALVFVTTSGGQTLSTVVGSNGVYILPLNTMLSQDLSHPLSLTDATTLQLLAEDATTVTQAQVLLSHASPVPIMTLNNNYNFVSSTTPIASTAASLGFPSFPTSNLSATPVITTPSKGEGFTDAQPQFSGTALPNQQVQVAIHSDAVVTGTTTTDANGRWTFRPSTPLSPGQHILSITTKNAQGILTTIEQSFVVYASGSQVSQSATPSGQLTPTATPTSTPKPTSTLTTTTQPTPSPTPVVTRPVSPKPTLPPTGSNTLVVSSVLGLVTTGVGIVLFVLTRGATL